MTRFSKGGIAFHLDPMSADNSFVKENENNMTATDFV